jgi:hypothetical protein
MRLPMRVQGGESPCDSKTFKTTQDALANPSQCRDYQELKVQEQISKLAVGTIPRSIWVVRSLVSCTAPTVLVSAAVGCVESPTPYGREPVVLSYAIPANTRPPRLCHPNRSPTIPRVTTCHVSHHPTFQLEPCVTFRPSGRNPLAPVCIAYSWLSLGLVLSLRTFALVSFVALFARVAFVTRVVQPNRFDCAVITPCESPLTALPSPTARAALPYQVLEDDLVDTCRAGDDVTVCGTVRQRWQPFRQESRCDLETVIEGNHASCSNVQGWSARPHPSACALALCLLPR